MSKPRAFPWPRLGAGLYGTVARAARAFIGNERGASSVVVGLTLPAMVGAMGLAAEVSYWHLHHRAMQNAADAAAIAAATNGGANYATEGKAVAAHYGFTDGRGHIKHSGMPKVTDPYASLASNIPANTCGDTYPQEPSKNGDPALPASNLWSGS